jgi:DNA invertase Pin-like site-specific DNA recombinase
MSNHRNGNGSQTRAVLYTRVSSKEQEQGGFSIPAQQKLLRDYAHTHGYTIVREFTDAETAKSVGRTAFKEMLQVLKRTACRVILVEKTDRLYRNLTDYSTLDGLDLEVHLVKENVILSQDSRSHDKFLHGIKVLMAKNYVDNLSEEVKKGMTEKALQGHYPSSAPLGYRNDPDTHRIVPHPVEGPLVTKLFQDATDPHLTLKDLAERSFQRGLVSRRNQKQVTIEGIRRILRNPIYWGPFLWKGKLYQGSHIPLVSKETFDEVQLALRANAKPRRGKHPFAFRGMVSCRCGRRLVGHLVRMRYRYYFCSARCGVRQIKESKLSDLFLEALKAIKIDPQTAEWLLTAIREFDALRKAERQETLARHQERQRQVQKRIDQAYDDKLEGRITEDYWTDRFNAWQEELAIVRAEIRHLESATFNTFQKADALINLCNRAPDLYVRQSLDEQIRLLKLITSNSVWDGVTRSCPASCGKWLM